MIRLLPPSLLLAAISFAPAAHAFFLDGDGHYGLRGETRTGEAFSKKTGTYQAIEQTFRLTGEARFNDQSSLFLEFSLFPNAREAYLGDSASPHPNEEKNCERGVAPDYTGPRDPNGPLPCNHQDTGEPRYKPYLPQITKAYVRYAFDYCIVEAGRRPRQWGLGIFMDSGNDPFETDASIYDGFTCNVNIQKTQTLGFSVGYDKLAESGTYVYVPKNESLDRRFGANDSGDDIDQYFFTIEYDDRKANAGASFTKQVGVYFAQVSSRAINDGGSSTDMKFLDLYTGFFFTDLSLRNELIFRMGKSADPNWVRLGGEDLDDTGNLIPNKLNAIALAGAFEWTLARSGAALGPAEYNKGDATRHLLFLNWAYAPGDDKGDGYLTGLDSAATTADDNISFSKRDNNVTALAFHRNYKPMLILFNGRPESDTLNVDGAFSPSRLMNATFFSTGYRYESLENGTFEAKLGTASLNKGAPGSVKEYYTTIKDQCAAAGNPEGCDDGKRPPGFFGTALGYELDLSYAYHVGRDAELGGAIGAALPGDAWQTLEGEKPVNNFLIQTNATFRF